MTVDGSFAARQCTVVDISEGGARLRVEDPQFVKPHFHLKFDRASPGRACKVAWKKGDLIGIEFVSADTTRDCRWTFSVREGRYERSCPAP